MTDWIDQLAGRLTDAERRENLLVAKKLRDDEMICALAPQFFQAVSKAGRAIATELNEKLGASLGGVTASGSDTSLRVMNGGPAQRVELDLRLNAKARQMSVTTSRKGSQFVPEDSGLENLTLALDDSDRLYVRRDNGVKLQDPNELASVLLREVFTEDLLRHRL